MRVGLRDAPFSSRGLKTCLWHRGKGDIKDLNSDTEQLFLNIDKTSFGFTAITKHTDKVKKQIPNIIVERPTIEDIMLSNIKGGQ